MHRTRDSRSRHKFSDFYRLSACCFLSLSLIVSSQEGYRANGKCVTMFFTFFLLSLCAWFFEVWLFFVVVVVFFNIYSFLRDRERQNTSREGADREGNTESEAGSRIRAVITESNVGLELTDQEIMT